MGPPGAWIRGFGARGTKVRGSLKNRPALWILMENASRQVRFAFPTGSTASTTDGEKNDETNMTT